MADAERRTQTLRADTAQRLVALCRLWGAVKYFHPYLAYRQIDWDGALIDTIPHVLAAGSADEYRSAIDNLLAVLHDSNTRSLPPAEGSAAVAVEAAGDERQELAELAAHHADHGIAVIVATDHTRFMEPDIHAKWNGLLDQTRDAKSIVFDLRQRRGSELAAWRMQQVFTTNVGRLIQDPLHTAGTRYRMHVGHPQQRGQRHGGYHSALVYEQGEVLMPAEESSPCRPLAFVIDTRNEHVLPIVAGLQAAGLAVVVQQGKAAQEAGVPGHDIGTSDGVRVRLRLRELVYPDGTVGFRPDAVVPEPAAADWDASPAVATALEALRRGTARRAPEAAPPPAVTYERDYPEMTAPAPPYRLLALFRLWNAIHYFFPYKHLLDRDWDDVLLDHLPRFARTGDAEDYALCVSRLAAETCDTHAFVNAEALRRYLGMHGPPVFVREIERETVVTHLLGSEAPGANAGDTKGVCVGDVVVAIDGEPVDARRAHLAPLLAASTPQALRWRLDRVLLLGQKDSAVTLTIRSADGGECDVTLSRSVSMPRRPQRTLPVFGVLPQGVGYVDLERLTVSQVDEAFEAIKDTPALIFDMRGYPNGTAWPIAPRLTEREVVTARFRKIERHGPDVEQHGERYSHQTAAPSENGRYAGKVAVLIDEDAISQAEHTCLFLEAAADVTFIGSPTNGANGDVTNVVLPGGVSVMFTGMEVTHADGRQLQRVGIQPHVPVEPTIAGIRAERDEVLETAIAFLRGQDPPAAR